MRCRAGAAGPWGEQGDKGHSWMVCVGLLVHWGSLNAGWVSPAWVLHVI